MLEAWQVAIPHSDKFPYHRSVMLSDPRPWLHQQPQTQERGQSLCRVGQRPIRVRLSIPTSYSLASRLAVALIRCATISMKAWGSTLDPHGKSGASHLDIFNPSVQCALPSLLSTIHHLNLSLPLFLNLYSCCCTHFEILPPDPKAPYPYSFGALCAPPENPCLEPPLDSTRKL